MNELKRPEGAEFWCPEYGDSYLEASAIEKQHVLIDTYGDVLKVREGCMEFEQVWCGACEKVLLDHEKDQNIIWRLLESDIQSYAVYGYGRRLDDAELSRLIKGLEHCLGEYSADVIGEIVSGIMVRTNTEPVDR